MQQYAARALAITGATEEAEAIAASISKEYPRSTLWHGRDLPIVEASIELRRGRPGQAVEVLRPARRFEITEGGSLYVRDLAFLALRRGQDAAAEFQKILNHPEITRFNYPEALGEYPASMVVLARAKVLLGDEAGARKAYEDFFDLWKDADADVPLLQEAKAEYEKLLSEVTD